MEKKFFLTAINECDSQEPFLRGLGKIFESQIHVILRHGPAVMPGRKAGLQGSAKRDAALERS
jgi:hypothetical protein